MVLGQSPLPVFAGRRVRIEHGYSIRAGSGLILEDDVLLNALSADGITLGRNVTIARSAILVCTGVVARVGVGIRIGDNSAVGAQSFLGGQGGLTIGNDVIMGPGVRIFTENHIYADLQTPIRTQGEDREPVLIEDNCWIGAGATVLAGTTIARGSVVAAGAVVTKSFPENSVLAGVPAKLVSTRATPGEPQNEGGR